MENLIIRPFEAGDVCAVSDIENVCFSNPWSKESFDVFLKENAPYRCYVVCLGDAIIGYICVLSLFEEGEIMNLAVHPDRRKNGAGQALLDFVFGDMKKRGVLRVTLEVRESNEPAKNLYLKNGFSPVFVRKKYYVLPTEDAVVMEKSL